MYSTVVAASPILNITIADQATGGAMLSSAQSQVPVHPPLTIGESTMSEREPVLPFRPWDGDEHFRIWAQEAQPVDWGRAMQYQRYDKGSTQKMVYRHQGWKGHQELMQQRKYMYAIIECTDDGDQCVIEIYEDQEEARVRAFHLDFDVVVEYEGIEAFGEALGLSHLSETSNYEATMRQRWITDAGARQAVYSYFSYDGPTYTWDRVDFFPKGAARDAA